MFKKTCFSCGRNSYSSNNTIKWLCPYCNQDISSVGAVVAEGPLVNPDSKEPFTGKDPIKNKDVV